MAGKTQKFENCSSGSLAGTSLETRRSRNRHDNDAATSHAASDDTVRSVVSIFILAADGSAELRAESSWDAEFVR